MCGICGEVRFSGGTADRDAIERMLPAVARRGPDGSGVYEHGAACFGHQRLSVIDLSERSAQPMVDSETGVALVFNGAIYNYKLLRSELIERGHSFRSSGDTEVILRGYLEWAESVVEQLSGMFAFAIYDPRSGSTLLARDRVGIKPLYFSRQPGRLRFASNPQAILAAGEVDTALNPVALHHQFMLHASVPAPHTVIEGVKKIQPGHWLQFDMRGNERLERYWHPHTIGTAERSDAEWVDATREALRLAVKRRTDIADVPVGVLLSGGLDSSVLVALLAEAGVTDLQTFTVGFDDQPEERGDEFEYSDMVAERYNTVHHKFHVPNDQLLSRLAEAVAAMAEPMVGQDAVAFYLLSERVAQEVKVVQSGQGADEVFAGYFWYPQMHAAEGEDDVTRFASRYVDRDDVEWRKLIAPAYHPDGDVTTKYIEALLQQFRGGEYLNRVLAMDVTSLIVDDPVKRVDNMTMAFGLEARVPFLDHELIELALSMPTHLKLAKGGKGILKTISRGIVPDPVIDRIKAYFPVPALKFVRGKSLNFMRDTLNSQACRERGLFQREFVDMLLDQPDQHFTRLQGSKLWQIALLELWLQQQLN